MTTATDHPEHVAEGVEPEGVPSIYLLGLTGFVGVLLVVIVLGAVQMAKSEFRRAEVEAVTQTGYPALRETQLAGEQLLTRYGVVDAEAGRYRIPIDRAIDMMVNEAARAPERPISDELQLTR